MGVFGNLLIMELFSLEDDDYGDYGKHCTGMECILVFCWFQVYLVI